MITHKQQIENREENFKNCIQLIENLIAKVQPQQHHTRNGRT